MHFLAFVSLITLAAAAPTELSGRAAATCGNTYYSANAVNAASQAACNFVKAGTKAGSSTYPHQYNNYEGFQFQGLSAPFYEFPILSSGSIYSGGESEVSVVVRKVLTIQGSPGADRVVITSSCKQAGTITHTGASGNNFVACQGTS